MEPAIVVLDANIWQESAYTSKLYEHPIGTSQRTSSLCNKQRKYKKHKIIVSKKQYPKDVFLSENCWETSHTCQGEFLSKEYPTDRFITETFLRKIFCWQLQKVRVMEPLSNYHQSPQRWQGVMHSCFCYEICIIHFQTVKPNLNSQFPFHNLNTLFT